MHLCFACHLKHEVRCGIFHLGCHIGIQDVSEFGAFWVLHIWTRDAQSVLTSPAIKERYVGALTGRVPTMLHT